MRAGDLREAITIRRPSVVVDDIGGQTEGTPIVVAAGLPAAVEPLGIGQERLQVGQLRGVVSTLVRIRKRTDLTDDMQIQWGTKTLEIGLVELRQKTDETWLYCAEVQ